MLTEPRDLDRSELKQVLEGCWGLRDPQLDYLAVGFGSHHWRAIDSRGTRRFVTVDDLEADFRDVPDVDSAFAALDRAFRTAAVLRDHATLEFVLAPLFDREGAVIRRLSHRYAITVSPFIEGESSEYGPYEGADECRVMGAVLGRLHAATEEVPNGLPRREDFELPSRAALVEALHDLDRDWDFGPFAEPARKLLQVSAHELERRLQEYDELAAGVRRSSNSWVITHGEPHRANVIRDPQGGVHLVDWDTTLIAPRERDLQMVLDQDLTGSDEYSELAGVVSLNHEALQLYRWWWELADIAVFVAGSRRPHKRTEDTVASWEILASNLASRIPAVTVEILRRFDSRRLHFVVVSTTLLPPDGRSRESTVAQPALHRSRRLMKRRCARRSVGWRIRSLAVENKHEAGRRLICSTRLANAARSVIDHPQ